MKTKKILVSILMLTLSTIDAQQSKQPLTAKTTTTTNQCEELKKENESLKKSLDLNEPLLVLSDNDIDFKITKVKGDIKTQMVTIELLFTNNIKNREIGINKGAMKIVTLEGDVLTLAKYVAPEQQAYDFNTINTYLNTGIPIKCTFTFGTLLPSNQYIKLFNLAYVTYKSNGYEKENSGANEFKDLKIEWK